MKGLAKRRLFQCAMAAGLFFGMTLLTARGCRAQSNDQDTSKSQDQQAQSAQGSSKDDGSQKKDGKPAEHGMTNIRITVTSNTGKPIENASVYVRFPESGGLFRHDKLQELDLKTNLDGSVKVPPVPQGKVLIQVIAKGWRTYGKWYEIDSDEQAVEIKLDPPPHWY